MMRNSNGLKPDCPAWVQMGGLRFNCARPGTRAHVHHWYIKLTSGGPIQISWKDP